MKSRIPFLALFLAITSAVHAELPRAAIAQLDRQLSPAPAIGPVFDGIIQRYADEGALDQLAAHLTAKAEAAGTDAPTYWLLVGALADQQGRVDDAIQFCRKAIALQPDNAQVSQSLANALFTGGRSRDAVAALQKTLADSKSPATRREHYRQLALGQLRASDADGALQTWQRLIKEFPTDASALEEAGDAIAAAGLYGNAASFYEAWRKFKNAPAEQQARAFIKLAQLAEVQYEADKARALYQSALPLVPADSWIAREIRLRIDDSYQRVDDYPGLAAAWASYVTAHGQDADAVLHLARALAPLRRDEEAIAWLRKAAEWAPARKDVKVALAQAQRNAGHPREAIAILQPLTAGDAADPADLARLGDAQWQLFRASKDEVSKRAAIETWQRLAPPSEKDATRVLRLATLLREHGLHDDALPAYERAADLAPEAPQFRLAWADALFDLKREEDARKVLRGLVEGPRSTPQNFLRLARAQFDRGSVDAALQSVRAGLEIDPKHFELLSLQWTLHATAKQWPQAADLAGKLVAAAPSLASAAQVQDNHALALRQLGKHEEAAEQDARRLTKGAPLSETESRLLVGLALRTGHLKLAGDALDDATRRFPDSAAFIYDRAELERRRGQVEPSVAALQRLAALQPDQKEAWLRKITRFYQDENLDDNARIAAQRLLDAAPASAEALADAARVARQAGDIDASVAHWRKAIRASDRPTSLRHELVRTYREAQRLDDERQTLLVAFDAETDPVARLDMTGLLADAFARSGRFDELIARFRERARTEKDGWRYAAYLAEIFRSAQDFPRAREELMLAWGPRSRDLLFLTQGSRLSRDSQNPADRARLARLLAEADPRHTREIELASALLQASETVAAMAVLRRNEEAILADPMPWHETLLQAAAAGLGESVASWLSSGLARHAGDWRLRFLLAETRMRTGDFAAAEKLLREVESTPVTVAALPPSTLPDANVDRSYEGGLFSGVSYGSGTGRSMGSEFARRNRHGYDVRRIMSQIAAGLNGVAFLSREPLDLPTTYRYWLERYVPQAPGEAADAALVMRSILAQQQDRGAEFVAELQGALKNVPRAERLARYSLVQALDPLLKEIAAEAAFPSEDEVVNAACFEVLMTLATEISPTMGSVDADGAALISLTSTFIQREKRPETALLGKLRFSKMLKRAGRENEARTVAREVLGQWASVPRAQLSEWFDFAVESDDMDAAEKILASMVADRRRPGPAFRDSTYLMRLSTATLARKPDPVRAVKLLTETLQATYAPLFVSISNRSLLNARSTLRRTQDFPYGSRTITLYRTQTWTGIFGMAKEHGLLEPLKAALDQQVQTLPPAESASARLARVCFSWWSNDRDQSIREVLDLAGARQDDELHLLAGSMLVDLGRRADAQKSFAQVTASSGEAGFDNLARQLALARAENDAARSRQIALRLAELPMSYSDQPIFQGMLSELGLAEKAAELKTRERLRGEGSYYSGLLGASQKLQRETQANRKRESIDLALAILARVSPAASAPQERSYRRASIEALGKFKALTDYTAELEQRLAFDPSSAETLLSLAEAFERENPAKAIEFYRRRVQLVPGDLSSHLRLAGLLTENRKLDEAVSVWKMAFTIDPQLVFVADFYPILSGFERAKQVSQLGAILINAPPRGHPLERFATGVREASSRFDQVAAKLRQEAKPDEAIRLWRASLARTRTGKNSPYPETATLKALLPALLSAGRQDEAAVELENYFFPPAPPKPALGFEVRSTARNWATLNFEIDGTPAMLGIPIMRLAAQAGALDRLRAKAVAASTAEPRHPEKFLVLLIDVLRRDPAKLAALKKAFDEAIESSRVPRNPTAVGLMQSLAQVLGEWPDGRALALHVYARTSGLGSVSESRLALRRADLALILRDHESARQALREWISWADQQNSGLSPVDAAQQLSAVDLMTRAGMTAEAATLLKKIQAAGDSPNRAASNQAADELANRLKLLAGDAGRAQIAVWAVPGSGASGRTTVCWEIGPVAIVPVINRVSLPKGAKPTDPPVSITGQDLPALDGKFTIELFHGPSESELQPLATIPAAGLRGKWESPKPLGQEYIVALLRTKDVEAYSQKSFVAPAPNLLPNPDPGSSAAPRNPAADAAGIGAVPGWPGLMAADFITLPGGPNPGGHFVRLGLLGDFNRSTTSLPRIPLEPGKSYYFTSWLRANANGGRAGLSGRFLDKDGAQLTQVSPVYTRQPGRWNSCELRMVRTRVARSDEGLIQIPEKAVFFEPSLYTGGNICELTGLYFGAIE